MPDTPKPTNSVIPKIQQLKNCLPYMKKDAKAYNFDYITEDSVLGIINPKLEELGLIVYPIIAPRTAKTELNAIHKTKIDKKGERYTEDSIEYLFSSDGIFFIQDTTTGNFMEVPWHFVGAADDASKAYGSAMTYCGRYFWLKFLQVPTGKDDPDKWRDKIDRKEDSLEAGKKSEPAKQDPPPKAEAKAEPPKSKALVCDDCGQEIQSATAGSRVLTPEEVAKFGMDKFKKNLCAQCYKKEVQSHAKAG